LTNLTGKSLQIGEMKVVNRGRFFSSIRDQWFI
jgi:hypothetical protein